ncbi:MAG: aldo/keto reductase [Clostridiales bacterium]|nr:aldo/keto reductase [Clostridiales bacterium]
MEQVKLGRTGLIASRVGLELSPLRELSFAASREALDEAIGRGITFFDLGLPDRETQKRIGHAIAGRRQDLILAGSFVPSTKQQLEEDIKWMLRDLKTEYLDLIQIHDPDYVLRPGEASGLFDMLLDAKKAGYIRNIGLTTGDPVMAMNALEYGWYDTLQYPWHSGSAEEELMVLSLCREAEVGSINVPLEWTPEEADREEAFQKNYPDHLSLWMLHDDHWRK